MIKTNYFSKTFSKLAPILLPLTLSFLVISATALGCAWYSTDHSVHFNDGRTLEQFGFLPPLPKKYESENNIKTRPWYYQDDGEYDSKSDTYITKSDKQLKEFWDNEIGLTNNSSLDKKAKHLEYFLEQTKRDTKKYTNYRNTAIDLLDVLSALKQGSSEETVRVYYQARWDFYKSIEENLERRDLRFEEINKALEPIKSEKNLSDNVKYLQAAILYQDYNYSGAEKLFDQIISKYPNSEKKQAALYMSALCAMKQSISYSEADCGCDREDDTVASCKNNKDKFWHKAIGRFTEVIKNSPKGLYSNNSRGWIAYLYLHANENTKALIEYYKMLGEKDFPQAQYDAATSLALVRHKATDKEMREVEKGLINDPKAALAYAYYEIYNYPTHNCYIPEYEDSVYYQKTPACFPEGQDYSLPQPEDISYQGYSQVVKFAEKMINHSLDSQIDGAFTLRVAMAKLQMGENKPARLLAERALNLGVKDEELWRTLLVKGIAEYRENDYKSAQLSLTKLIDLQPTGRLMITARRNLAIAAENAVDIDTALEQYIALDYQLDVAYLIDVIMTSDQLSKFISNHPSSPQYNELLYALGIRYMREDKLKLAKDAFSRVHTISSRQDTYYRMTHESDGSSENETINNPKYVSGYAPSIDWSVLGIREEWLLWDLGTINSLERLKQIVDQAQGDEAKAEALYKLASYKIQRGSLTYYNPAAWRGQARWFNFGILNSSGETRLPNEAALVWKHFQEHEHLSQALNGYLEIYDKYPNTRAARDAFYTAAVCHERLSNYNAYWRAIYEKGLFAGSRNVTYEDVRNTYPKYGMPIGTYGWEPFTRTVNGGPAWYPPPTPTPRKPFWQRVLISFSDVVEDKVDYVKNSLSNAWYYLLFFQLSGALISLLFIRRAIKPAPLSINFLKNAENLPYPIAVFLLAIYLAKEEIMKTWKKLSLRILMHVFFLGVLLIAIVAFL